MSWLPIGPDFVFAPRNQNFKRLSRRNELGRQGLASCVVVDQSDPAKMYNTERPTSGGTAVFRTLDGGNHWTAVSDPLLQANPLCDPNWIALNPVHPNVLYMASFWDSGFYISNDRGDTWGTKKAVPGRVNIFRVIPTQASDLANTHILLGADNGVYYSDDSGDTWNLVAPGNCQWLALHVPATGTAQYYAAILNVGVLHTNVPTDPWTNLHNAGIGLPQYVAPAAGVANNFNNARIDICPRNPSRVYIWLATNSLTEGFYTSNNPLVSWTKMAAVTPPSPAYGFYNFEFAVAPNSPGDGVNDILFVGSVGLHRSTNSGVNWSGVSIGFHADQQAFDFYPQNPGAGVIPLIYVGCDGGLARSTKFCNPAFDVAAAITYHNEEYQYTDTGSYENLNYAKQVSQLYQYTSHSDMNALSYIGCQDTGVASAAKTLGWRGIADADGGAVAIAPGADCVKFWGLMGAYGDYPSFRIVMWNDRGEFSPWSRFVNLNADAGALVNPTSDFEIATDNTCLVGARVRDEETNVPLAIVGNAAAQEITPASMVNIVVGRMLTIDQGIPDGAGGSLEETFVVSAVTATTFTAIIRKNHAAAAKILHTRAFVARIDQAGIARQISQVFGPLGSENSPLVNLVAPHPSDSNLLACKTNDNKVFKTTAGSTATSATVWSEITVNKPAIGTIQALAWTPDSHLYAFMQNEVNGTDAGGGALNSPLYELSTDQWIAQPCSGAPATTGDLFFAKLVAHPTNSNILFGTYRGKIYRIVKDTGSGIWNFEDISENLPGEFIYDLWVGFHSLDKREENVILRVGIPTRGVWEKVFNEFGENDAVKLYVRDHFMDQGLLSRSEEGVTNPYDPTGRLYHYMCADIKLDTRQPGTGGVAPFFQNEPEDGLPISHVSFNKLIDNSLNLPGSNPTQVHVQVQNRSTIEANNVYVWAIYCNAASGVPALSKSASNADNFPFWNQFLATGEIIPGLPGDSPWTSVGTPVVLNGLDGFQPQIASWLWNTPTLATGDSGHYCMVTFIHSAANPINESSFNVDYITPRNRQVGQKNLHVGPPLPATPPGGGSPGTGGSPAPVMREYLEFHNPEHEPVMADLHFEFSRLPANVEVSLQFTRLQTSTPLQDAFTGIRQIRKVRADEQLPTGEPGFFERFFCFLKFLICLILNFFRKIFKRPVKACSCRRRRPLPPFADVIYEVEPGKDVKLEGIQLAGMGFGAVYMRLRSTGDLPEGMRYPFNVLQLRNNRVVGGSEFIVRIAGDLKPFKFDQLPDLKEKNFEMVELHRRKLEAQEQRFLPSWILEQKKRREEEMGKRPAE
jgi:hypothetical protein